MQKNNADKTAKDMIKTGKLIFGEKIQNIVLSNVTDEPYKMFSIKFTIYNYFVLVCNYDRGHFGCNIAFGKDAITLRSNIEWDDDCDFIKFWNEIDEQIRLRIPDKYLKANNWL